MFLSVMINKLALIQNTPHRNVGYAYLVVLWPTKTLSNVA